MTCSLERLKLPTAFSAKLGQSVSRGQTEEQREAIFDSNAKTRKHVYSTSWSGTTTPVHSSWALNRP